MNAWQVYPRDGLCMSARTSGFGVDSVLIRSGFAATDRWLNQDSFGHSNL
jgi:hypothetical protein